MLSMPTHSSQARELAAHLHALRATCRTILERIRLDPEDGTPSSEAATGDADRRRRNRLLGVQGRNAFIGAERRCTLCLDDVSRNVLVLGGMSLGGQIGG